MSTRSDLLRTSHDVIFTDGLANLEAMLYNVGSFGQDLPAACQNTCKEAWAVLDAFVVKYGTDGESAEHATRVIRHGLALFGQAALDIGPAVVGRMSAAFDATYYSSYLWVVGKIVQALGNEEEPTLRESFRIAYEQSTNRVVALLQEKQPGMISDGMFLPTRHVYPL